jgi:hypothetical protein
MAAGAMAEAAVGFMAEVAAGFMEAAASRAALFEAAA